MGKQIVDLSMTILLLLLMPYEMVGQEAHEWMGIGIFLLFVVHHILNRRWSRSLFKGKYTLFRSFQTFLVLLVLASMLGSMISGVMLSRHVLSFLPIKGGRSFARKLHMLSAYWGFLWMSLHLGVHWGIILGRIRKLLPTVSDIWKWILRGLFLVLAIYGGYVFVKQDISSYLFLKTQFVFFDFERPLVLYLSDYLAMMGLFVGVGYYLSEAIKRIGRKKSFRKEE